MQVHNWPVKGINNVSSFLIIAFLKQLIPDTLNMTVGQLSVEMSHFTFFEKIHFSNLLTNKTQHCYTWINHKSYNFLDCDWFKRTHFSLIHLPSCYRTAFYWTVCYRTFQWANRIHSCKSSNLNFGPILDSLCRLSFVSLLMQFFRFFHNLAIRVFLSRNYRLIVPPQKFNVLKTSIFALEASPSTRGNYHPGSSTSIALYCLIIVHH